MIDNPKQVEEVKKPPKELSEAEKIVDEMVKVLLSKIAVKLPKK